MLLRCCSFLTNKEELDLKYKDSRSFLSEIMKYELKGTWDSQNSRILNRFDNQSGIAHVHFIYRILEKLPMQKFDQASPQSLQAFSLNKDDEIHNIPNLESLENIYSSHNYTLSQKFNKHDIIDHTGLILKLLDIPYYDGKLAQFFLLNGTFYEED